MLFIRSLSVAALSLMVLFGLGCATTGGTKSVEGAMQGEFKGAPKWVTMSCNAFDRSKQKRLVCGVGSAAGSRNITIMRRSAGSAGRAEIARTLQVKVYSMLKSYAATTTGGENFGTAANDEQHIVDASKEITDQTLSGSQHADTWVSPNGTMYMLMTLEVGAFKDMVSQMNQLNEQVRAAVVERAENAFEELDKEIEKERAQ
jgi:hypothetical protein